MIDHKEIHSKIYEAKAGVREIAEQAKRGPLTKEEFLGLKFRPGQRFVNKENGKEVIVLGSTRKTVSFRRPGSEGRRGGSVQG